MKLSHLTIVLLRLETLSAAEYSSLSLQRIRSLDRVVAAKAPAGKVTTNSGSSSSRRKLLETTGVGFDFYSMSMSMGSFAFDEPPIDDVTFFIRNVIADVAECAGVDMDVHGGDCVFEYLFEQMMRGMVNPTGELFPGVRRMLQPVEETNSDCDEQPTEADVKTLLSLLLVGHTCTAMEVEKTTSDLFTIISSPECTGMTPCDGPTTSSTSNSTITTTSSTNSTYTEEEDIKLPSSTTPLVPTTKDASTDESTAKGDTIHETHSTVVSGDASSTINRKPLIAIAGGLVALTLLVGGFYRMKNSNSNGIIHPDEKSTQSINSKSTDESEMGDSESSIDEANSHLSSLAIMAGMSTLVATTSRVDRRASI